MGSPSRPPRGQKTSLLIHPQSLSAGRADPFVPGGRLTAYRLALSVKGSGYGPGSRMASPACSTPGATTPDVVPPTPPGPALPAPGESMYTRTKYQQGRRPSPPLLPVQCCGQLSHGTAAGTVIGNSALMGTYVRDEYRLFQRFPHCIPVLFPGFQQHSIPHSSPDSACSRSPFFRPLITLTIAFAPAVALLLHSIGVVRWLLSHVPRPFKHFSRPSRSGRGVRYSQFRFK